MESKINVNVNVNVMVVENNFIAQRLAEIILSELGCKVEIAKDGETALGMFKANKYNLVLMDIGLPGMDGIETTKEIRKFEQEAGLVAVPIIALSVADDVPWREAGMNDFISKPLYKWQAEDILNEV